MPRPHQPGAARVRVPASTSNLGSGFDCVGLALDRYLIATYEPGAGPLRLQRTGTLAPAGPASRLTGPDAPRPLPDASAGDDLLAGAFREGMVARGLPDIGGVLRVHSDIPVARGLGSSGAAVIAGLALAASAAHDELDRSHALDRATHLEGHPDNVAPALYGGLVAVSPDGEGRYRPVRLPLSDAVGFAFAAPGTEVSTAEARAALPQHVSRDTAIHGLGRIAALLQGLAVADPDLIRIGFTDELHVPYRLPLIPGARAAIEAAHEAGAWAATISGSGSGLIAACPPDQAGSIAAAMANAFRREAGADGLVSFATRPDRQGAQLEDEMAPHPRRRTDVPA